MICNREHQVVHAAMHESLFHVGSRQVAGRAGLCMRPPPTFFQHVVDERFWHILYTRFSSQYWGTNNQSLTTFVSAPSNIQPVRNAAELRPSPKGQVPNGHNFGRFGEIYPLHIHSLWVSRYQNVFIQVHHHVQKTLYVSSGAPAMPHDVRALSSTLAQGLDALAVARHARTKVIISEASWVQFRKDVPKWRQRTQTI